MATAMSERFQRVHNPRMYTNFNGNRWGNKDAFIATGSK